MSTLVYPEVGEYKHPKKNVLVISCMDLRLTDNLLEFLHFDNLHNRYDHFILAGTSLLCTHELKDLFLAGKYEAFAGHWQQTMKNHLELAVALHQIKDVYIIEHQDCGAYSNLLDPAKVDLSTLQYERKFHTQFAVELAQQIHCEIRQEQDKQGNNVSYRLGVHCFFIDLRGNVELLHTLEAE